MANDFKPYPLKLHHTLRFGKHKGETLQWVIDNEIEYVKYLHRKNLIGFDALAWQYFLDKVRGNETYKRPTTTLFHRYSNRRK